mgnify:CR=1 FL=1
MSFFWLSLFLAEEAPLKLWKHVPIEASPESVLFTQVSQQAVACTVEMDLRVTGEVRFLSPLSCPDSLFRPVREAVSQWRFFPATEADRAYPATQKLTAVFESGTVVLETETTSRYAHIRVPPAAIPLWPKSPQKDSRLRELFAFEALRGGSCVLFMEVSRKGQPENLVIEDCPNEVAHQIEKSLRRWGMNVVGAELGDGNLYRLEMRF